MEPQIGTINSHYVQKARLKNFSWQKGKHNKIIVADLGNKKIGSRNIESAFYQKGLYTNDVEVEMNDLIEKPGMRVFDKIYSSQHAAILTRNDLEILKKYLLVQLYRNPTNMSHYSPNWEGDILGLNKKYETDAKAYQHISNEIHTICSTSWKDLLKTKDKELSNNIHIMRQTCTMFVRSQSLEFVINDLGSVCERHPWSNLDENLVKKYFKDSTGIDFSDEIIQKLISTHQYYDNFTFYPISSHFGIITISPIWSILLKYKHPYRISYIGPNSPLRVDVDYSFYDWIAQTMGLYSEFIKQLFIPCANVYESPELQKAYCSDVSMEKFEAIVEEYSSPNDKYLFPVIDLNLEWAEYLNRLTINEAKEYFAFESQLNGEISIANYEMERVMYCQPGEAKHDLGWIDPTADWREPLS